MIESQIQDTEDFVVPIYEPIYVEPIEELLDGDQSAGKPRLMINRIVNINFKSYAGKKVLGPFHKYFTSIVGPNGSGKSNIIDAMLYVFGFRSKTIRSKKLVNLIHKSTNESDIDSATVGIHFQYIVDTGDGPDEYTVMPDSKFVISRTVQRTGVNFYKINGEKCRFNDVITILKKGNVDIDHKRFLILQGEVEQISMMKPVAQNKHDVGMLDYLEDIIGTSRYKEPIEQLTLQVEELNNIRNECFNRIKTSESVKEALEAEKDIALDYINKQNKSTETSNLLFQRKIYDIKKNTESERIKLEELGVKKSQLSCEFKEYKTSLAQAQQREVDLISHIKVTTQKQKEMDKIFSKYEVDDCDWRDKLVTINKRISKAKKLNHEESKKLAEVDGVPESKEKEVKFAQKQRKVLNVKMEAYHQQHKTIMETVSGETREMRDKRAKLEIELAKEKNNTNDISSKISIKTARLKNLQSEDDYFQNEIDSIVKRVDESKCNLNELKSNIKNFEKRNEEVVSERLSNKRYNDKTNKDLKDLSEKIKSEISKQDECRSNMQQAKFKGAVLNTIMEQKSKGNFKGVLGRLGDLGAVDDKYNVAVSTACGSLDYIVVERVSDAQECVDFLKRYNVGRGSFIVLEKLNKWTNIMNSKPKFPNGSQRLFDLIKVQEDRVRNAFYFGLRDTLVVEDLNTANDIAYNSSKRYRVVTLVGQIIEMSGAISGGGRSLKGRISSFLKAANVNVSFTAENIEQKEEFINGLKIEYQNLLCGMEKFESNVQNNERTLISNKNNIEKMTSDIKYISEQIETDVKLMGEKKDKLSKKSDGVNKVEISQLGKEIMRMQKSLDSLYQVTRDYESNICTFTDKIKKVTGTKLLGLEKDMEVTNEKIGKIDIHVANIEVDIVSAKDQKVTLTLKIEKLTKDLESYSKEEQLIQEKLKKNESDVAEFLSSRVEIDEQVSKAQQEISDCNQAKDEYECKMKEIKSLFLELKHEIDQVKHHLGDSENQIKSIKQKIVRLEFYKISAETPEVIKKIYNEEELLERNIDDIVLQLTVYEQDLLKMSPNMGAIEEYREKSNIHYKRVRELDKITNVRDERNLKLKEFKMHRLNFFMKGFTTIGNHLKQLYQLLTLGGDAELELVDVLEPFSEGVVFSVRPLQKSWKPISNLSGGEKTLSSLALIFALHEYRPNPFYIMDEIDAALDFRNKRKSRAQFIIISLRSDMFELSDRLIGVYKTHDVTKTVAMDVALLEENLKKRAEENENQVPVTL